MFEILNSYVEQGLLKRQVSPCGELVLYDYSEKCQFEKAWDEITLNHRGTVYSLETGEIVARAFPKFFNFSELSPEEQKTRLNSKQFSVYEKLDGSLGIIYYYNGTWRVNTRGSFVSDQAKYAAHMLNKLDYWKLDKSCTYLVEIVYPENRIVVDYKGEEFVALLEILDTKTGEDRWIEEDQVFKYAAKCFPFASIQGVINKLGTLPFNEEGYVVKFQDESRAKFKGDEYVEMHRLISGLSPLTIWDNMKEGLVSEEFLAKIPEEFRDRYSDIALQLEDNYEIVAGQVELRVQQVIASILQVSDNTDMRKKVGLYLKENDHPLNVLVFPTVLGKKDVVDKLIMKEIRPKGNIL